MKLLIFNHVDPQKEPFYYASLASVTMCCFLGSTNDMQPNCTHKQFGP